MTPRSITLEHQRSHRLIPSEHSVPALADLGDDAQELMDIALLDGATSRRLQAQDGRLPGIEARELVYGIRYASIVNAAFTYARPTGGRFNGPERGAWYASFALATALAEVVWHHTHWLAEIGHFEDNVTKDEWLADFSGEFHDLSDDARFAACLALDPALGYPTGQALALTLLGSGSPGLVYPSVRHDGGTNIVCFRPPLVENVQKGQTVRLIWSGSEMPTVS